MGKRSSLRDTYIDTKSLMGNEFGEVCKIFGKNQLPPVFQESAEKNRRRRTPPRVSEKFVGRVDENRGNRPDAT